MSWPVAALTQPILLERPLGPLDRRARIAGLLGAVREAFERDDEPVAVLVLCVQHPFVREVGQQGTRGERDRLASDAPSPTASARSNRSTSTSRGRSGAIPTLERSPARYTSPPAASSAPRTLHRALRSDARALVSSTSGQKRAARRARGWRPG